MNKIILLIVLIGMTSAMKADAFQSLWSAWKTQHKKTYSASEELTRFGIFIENFEKINRLNKEYENDGLKFGLNQFADLTGHEFNIKYVKGTFYDVNEDLLDLNAVTIPVGDLPESVDWREKGAVTPVKNQGNCGSCWAFSTVGVLESFYFINNGKLLSFSEQQLVDCNTINHGCSGGIPPLAVKYAAQNGLELESDYPYAAKRGTCQYDKTKAITVASGYKIVTRKSSEQLKAALVNSPVSVAVQANQAIFQHYKSGVVTKDCGMILDHAVLAVGYKKIDGVEAFIVKNSWSNLWGQEGYIYIGTDQSKNNGNGVCGILALPTIPTNES